jgi:uncharacterized membrane protein YdjX (TVP38/TMEM64 family)
VLASLAFFPVTLLTVATVFTFGPAVGGTYAMVGWMLSAALGYGAGYLLCRDLVRQLAGSRFERLEQQASRNGLVAVLAMRVLPVAPFTLVNLFIGASRISFGDFIAGSLLGRIPGLVALTVFEYQLENALRAPDTEHFVLLALALVVVIPAYLWLIRQFREDESIASKAGLALAGPQEKANSKSSLQQIPDRERK